MMNKFLILFSLLLTSCYHVPDQIEPRLSLSLEHQYLDELKSPFNPLSEEERATDWGKEYTIAVNFAKNFDLYRAISTFKRAEVLVNDRNHPRLQEISYFTILCYYLGEKYLDAVRTFENSSLTHIDESFPLYEDLMLILHESYAEIGDLEKASHIKSLLKKANHNAFEKLEFSNALQMGDLETLSQMKAAIQDLHHEKLLNAYDTEKKSVNLAQGLNAVIPGAGYLYLGQKKSAVTSFLLNGLFISASYYFFNTGNIAAGIITTSFEAGWYFGGIYGAGESAKYYNERIYEKHAGPYMYEKKLFPVFMLHYGF